MNPDDARIFSERLKLFAQQQRLVILGALLDGPLAVSQIEAETGVGQPTLSQQLGSLRRAGIISARRDSRAVFYQFASDTEARRFQILIALMRNQSISEFHPGHALSDHPRLQPQRATSHEGGAQFARIRMRGTQDV
jgi:ArsR family transcriptional regulator, virulence genes transcriptional regulator